ncbi:MAG: DegV family EDD domain-containing protein [Butyrivibrio sp.]|nr:DegV family EDD domain-containing protein [Butyrivibrio sp.]
MKLFRKIQSIIFDPAYDRDKRVLVFFSTVAMAVLGFALIGDVIIGENMVEIIMLIIMFFLIPPATVIAIRKNMISVTTRIISLSLSLVVLPIIFLFGGGLTGGAIPWFVFGFLYMGLVLSGWWRPALIALHTLALGGLFMLGYYRPDLIMQHTRGIFYVDAGLGIVEVGLTICFMTWFQTRMYIQESRRAREETHKVEEMNRSQNRFFSSMSHEIRTPINSILGLNEIILRQEDASEEIIRDAGNIQGAGRMLLALINDILDFSKIEAGKMDIVPVNYSVAALVSEIVNMMWLRAEQKGLEFKIEVDPSIPAELFGDEVRIKQILINLLNNAVKYTQEGSVTLHIEKEDVRENQVLLMFSVIDTGMGIKRDALPYLFDAFQRVDEQKNTKIEGTGLGLAIVKQLVELMDGKITVDSSYTQGSTFMVALWQKVARADAVGNVSITNMRNSMNSERYQAGFTAPDVRILIVDDNEMNLEVEKKLLAGTLINVDTAISGEKALSMTMSARYDMILMDHLMPEMDGIECLQHIRKQAGSMNNHVPVILLTANAGSENQELYSNSGFDGYLVKPVTGQQLEESILAHLPEFRVIRREGAGSARQQMNTSRTYSRKIPVMITAGSICDLPVEVINEQQIDVIPFRIHTNGRTYYDALETETDELLRYVRAGADFRCEPPSIEEYEAFFGRELKKSHQIIYIAGSSFVFSEYENACSAAKAYGNVRVYDSGQISGGIGLMVLMAQKMNMQGRPPERILKELEQMKNLIRCTFVTDGSYFLYRRNQVNKSIYGFIQSLNTHPFVRVKNGRTGINGIALGEQDRYVEKFTKHAIPRTYLPDLDLVLVIYSDLSENERNLIQEKILKRASFRNIIFQKTSGVMATSSGPGSFGIIFMDNGSHSLNLSSMLVNTEEEEAEEEEVRRVEAPAEQVPEAVREENAEVLEEPEAAEKAWYDDIPGIDAQVAITNSGTEESFRMVLKIFYDSVKIKSDELDGFYRAEDWENYTIKIHALKSSARLVGAVQLSEDAAALEQAGTEGNADYIRENHDRVMTDFRSYQQRLSYLFEEEKKTDEGLNEVFDRFLIESAYEAIQEGAQTQDREIIEQVFREIGEYTLPPEDAAKMEQLKMLFDRDDLDGMAAMIGS